METAEAMLTCIAAILAGAAAGEVVGGDKAVAHCGAIAELAATSWVIMWDGSLVAQSEQQRFVAAPEKSNFASAS